MSRIELTKRKKRSQPAEIAIELEKLCLRVSAAALTASINSNIVETTGIVRKRDQWEMVASNILWDSLIRSDRDRSAAIGIDVYSLLRQ